VVGYKHAEMALLDQLKMKLKRTLRENILNIPAFPAFPALHKDGIIENLTKVSKTSAWP